MRWPDDRPLRRFAGPVLATAAALGLTVWIFLREHPRPPRPEPAQAHVVAPVTAGDLPALHLTIADADWRVLAAARERALAEGVLVQETAAMVPVTATFGASTATGLTRLKGDWLDHVDTDQWSLRLELETPLAGMRRFSIQHPKTRGFVMEWLVMTTARREGILAPRVDFVQVAINGQPRGVYYLEEHFSKELLEAQGRRDGPIVRFDESALWSMVHQHAFRGGSLPVQVAAAGTLLAPAPEAYGEPRLAQVEELNRRLHRALEQIRVLQETRVAEFHDRPLRRQQALARLEGRRVDDVFAADRVGDWLALYTLFHCLHGLSWHQLRFYHDPVLDRLEPIAFDTGANVTLGEGVLALAAGEAESLFMRSPRVWEAAYRALGRFTEPQWHAEWIAAVRPAAERAVAAMVQTGMVPAEPGVGPIFDEFMRRHLALLRAVARPAVAADFAARVIGARTPAGAERIVEVEAWAITDVPVRVHGFRFQNGRVVAAGGTAPALAGDRDAVLAEADAEGSVLLPRDGSHVLFRFPLDRRLADLNDVRAIKAAIREQVEPDRGQQVGIDVLFRSVTETVPRAQPLVLRRLTEPLTDTRGRPVAESLADLLARHPFLAYDFAADRLSVPKGQHTAASDLILPDDRVLHLAAGARLLLPPGGVIVVGSVVAEGIAAEPVELGPADPAAGWAGLLVVGRAQSHLRHCRIRGTTAIDRGGWQTTGGVTFYHAPVDMEDCAFLDSRGEDACNLFGAKFKMTRTEFRGAVSDLLDGDFVTGEIVDCVFADSVGDAVDLSGARVTVRGVQFSAIGDKAVSVGEDSTVRVEACTVASASIAVAAKDRSDVDIDRLTIGAVEHYALAVYVKKPEYGPATVRARGLDAGARTPLTHLVQSGCTLTVDGVALPGVAVDVDDLYRRRVLGK